MTKPDSFDSGFAAWRSAALFLITLLCVIACALFAHRLMFSIVGAVTLAVVTRPVSNYLRSRRKPTLAATGMVLLVSLLLFLPMYLLVKHLVLQAISLVQYIRAGGVDMFLAGLNTKHPRLGGWLQNAITQFAPGISGREVAGWFAPKLGNAFSALARGMVDLVLMLFFYFFLVRDEEAALRTWASLLPLRRNEEFDFSNKLRDIINAVFAGRMLIAMLQGTTAGLAYWALGVPGALLWGFVTFVCCLVPAFGAFLAWVPICLYLGLAQSWTKCIILAAWCGGVVSTMDNFLYPVFVGRRTDLHTGVIFVAIFGGLAFFGISGFILGPVLVASTMLLLRVWQQRLAEADAH